MKHETGVIGNFATAEGASVAATTLRQDGFAQVCVYSPINDDQIQPASGDGNALLGILAFSGAIAGAVAGLFLTIQTSTQWPLMTGGQPIVSLPPFLVISFELTILFGVLATFLGLLWSIRQRKLSPKFYDSRFSVDRFGVYVPCEQIHSAQVRRLLSDAGAEEVRDEKL